MQEKRRKGLYIVPDTRRDYRFKLKSGRHVLTRAESEEEARTIIEAALEEKIKEAV